MAVLRHAQTQMEVTLVPVSLATVWPVTDTGAWVSCTHSLTVCVVSSQTFSDVNECREGMDSCEQQCSNTIGSFMCNCSAGYRLDLDGHTCNGKTFCQHALLSQTCYGSVV